MKVLQFGDQAMIEISKRKAVFSELKGYCHHAGDNDFMEVTKWSNGEGYDICIDRKNGHEKFSLTFGEFDLLTVLMNWKGE
jgi:hypothetical protein